MQTKVKLIAGKKPWKYWADIRKKSLQKKPLNRTPIKKKAYTIKKKSKKLSVEEKLYLVLRKDFLIDHPVCECGRKDAKGNICQRPAVEIHHKKGRGKLLNVVEFWLAVARVCHNWIGDNSKAAMELGLTLKRNT